MTTSNFGDVGKFHEKHGLPNVTFHGANPMEVTNEMLQFRIQFMMEELLEFIAGCGGQISLDEDGQWALALPAEPKVDHAQTFDALLDLAYVVFGTAHLMGYPWQTGWMHVQAANMTKVRAKPDGSDSKRGSGLDVVKPEGWRPPDIAQVLRRYGWDIPLEENQ